MMFTFSAQHLERYLLAVCIGILTATLLYFRVLLPINAIVYDSVLRSFPEAPADNIVIVGIDQYSLNNVGAWPWPRDVLADMLTKIMEKDPLAVGVDIILDQPRNPVSDRRLANVLQSYDNITLPVFPEKYQSNNGQLVEVLPLPIFISRNASLGHVAREIDPDGVLRRVHLKAGIGVAKWPSFALEMAKKQGSVDAVLSRTLVSDTMDSNSHTNMMYWKQNNIAYLPYASANNSFPVISAFDVLNGYDFDLKNKFVLIGATALGLGDTLITPASTSETQVSGVEVIANELQAINANNLIMPISLYWQMVIAFLVTTLVTYFYTSLSPRKAAVLGLVALVVVTASYSVSLIYWNIHWQLAEILLVLILSYMLSSWQRLSHIVKVTNRELLSLTKGDGKQANAQINKSSILLPTLEDSFRFLSFMASENSGTVKEVNNEIKEILLNKKFSSRTKNELISRKIDTSPSYRMLGSEYVRETIFSQRNIATTFQEDSHSYDTFINKFEELHNLHSRVNTFRDFVEKAFDEIESGIIVSNGHGVPLVVNNKLREMLLLGDNERIQYFDEFLDKIPTPKNIKWPNLLMSVINEAKELEFETRLNNTDIIVYVSSYLDTADYQHFIVVNLIDISNVKQTQREKEIFTSFLAHDLRSPLTSILAACELTKLEAEETIDATFVEKLLSRVSLIEKNANKTLHYTNQLLNLRFAESLNDENMRQCPLLEIIESAYSSNESFAKANGISLLLKNDMASDAEVFSSKDMLERAITNIINNAIKYSNTGSVVEIKCQQQPNNYQIIISDQGSGIAAEELASIFQIYQRTTNRKINAEKGMGLGLAFVKTVIDRHKGSISVNSKLGIGTIFTINLPA